MRRQRAPTKHTALITIYTVDAYLHSSDERWLSMMKIATVLAIAFTLTAGIFRAQADQKVMRTKGKKPFQ